MKKLLLGLFLLIFAGIGFAKMPTIINPPRPVREYKWLLVVNRRDSSPRMPNSYNTVYIYTNDYKIEKVGDSFVLIFKNSGWFCNDTSFGGVECGSLGHFYVVADFDDQYRDTLYFLKAKAPKLKEYYYFNFDSVFSRGEEGIKEVPILTVQKPQKAKVVFLRFSM